MRNAIFTAICLVVAAATFGILRLIGNDYLFFAGYVVLQYVVLAMAWNVLGGYTGYVNFGSAAFFALGAYSTVALHKFDPGKPLEVCIPFGACFDLDLSVLAPVFPLPIPVLIVFAAIFSGAVGLGMGYLTLRLRGAFFAIATLAMAVVLQTFVINWSYVGGARGAYVIRPNEIAFIGPYIHYLFLLMLGLAVMAIVAARGIERSRLGYGFAAIRDDELAAEAAGVPTLKLKLIATTISGALMGMAGAPFPYYIGYVQPATAFGLEYAVNSIAMPMIGGTTYWVGPLIGAILLGVLQQFATVTISSAVNLLIVGLLIVDCVIIAPNGILGLIHGRGIARPVVADPAVFILLYVLNTVPIFYLHEQGAGARVIELIFWGILIYVSVARGRIVGARWLPALPIAAAVLNGVILSILLLLSVIPGLGVLDRVHDALANLAGGVPGIAYLPLVSLVIMIAALGCGLLLKSDADRTAKPAGARAA
jgi:branched-chain amino acid transport system permease protein